MGEVGPFSLAFPNADHNDRPDALEMALRLASKLVNEKFVPQTEVALIYFT